MQSSLKISNLCSVLDKRGFETIKYMKLIVDKIIKKMHWKNGLFLNQTRIEAVKNLRPKK